MNYKSVKTTNRQHAELFDNNYGMKYFDTRQQYTSQGQPEDSKNRFVRHVNTTHSKTKTAKNNKNLPGFFSTQQISTLNDTKHVEGGTSNPVKKQKVKF
ncbi:hypothetical protein CDAR_309941 [Caerostris darwini]|uniref:Uncharacterized protein n=1 Tax=Caerostris darwini TaxID=1538125 RepID=A0AAV4VXC8_9ARAC|nr:hypothetical protein CDAR_309941 [Caerostris darwini]